MGEGGRVEGWGVVGGRGGGQGGGGGGGWKANLEVLALVDGSKLRLFVSQARLRKIFGERRPPKGTEMISTPI